MDYLIFDTEEAAIAVERAIFAFGTQLAAADGYAVGAEGIHGMRGGVSDATTSVTDSWDIPRQRLDGKWCVIHPKYHSEADDKAVLASLMGQLVGVVVESDQSDWWGGI